MLTERTVTTADVVRTDYTLPGVELSVVDPADFDLTVANTPEGLRNLYTLLQSPIGQQLMRVDTSAPSPASP